MDILKKYNEIITATHENIEEYYIISKAYADAQEGLAKQKLECEHKTNVLIEQYVEKGYKITEARTKAKQDTIDDQRKIIEIEKAVRKNKYYLKTLEYHIKLNTTLLSNLPEGIPE